MKTEKFLPFKALPRIEQILILLVLILCWGGLIIALIQILSGNIENPGELVWSQVLASCVLAVLALLRPKKDIVSILTPVYAIIIFFSLDIPGNILLLVLYACTLTILLWRLETRYGHPGSMQYV